MLTKRQVFLIALAILSVLIAAATLFYTKKIEQQLQEPMLGTFYQPETQPELPSSTEIDPLQEDFDALLSGASLGELYDGVTDYGFTGTQE